MENEEKNQEEQQPAQSVWKEIWDYAKIILVVFVIAFLLGHFVYINARVPSGSMEQTIMTGDRVFGNRLAYKNKEPERFDIVIFKYPVDDSFCPETPEGSFGPYTVPEDCYFMLGDNRNHSMDSRYWTNTFVEKDAIEAQVAVRYWPLNKMGTVK